MTRRPHDLRKQSPLYHLWMAFWCGAAILALHVISHVALQGYYIETIKESLTLAAKIYQIRYDQSTGEYCVYQDSLPWALLPRDQQAGPMGIGKSTPFRGLIADTDRQLRELTRRARGRLDDFVTTFHVVEGVPTKEVVDQGTQWIVCILRERFAELQALDLRAAVRRARELVESAASYRRGTTPPSVAGEASLVTRAVTDKVVATLSKLASLGLEPEAMPHGAREALLAKLDFAFVFDTGESPAGSMTPTPGSDARELAELRAKLTERVVKVAVKEVHDCFWMFGCLRWVEIVFWVWFGILTKMLYGYGLFAVGRAKGRVFEPNESVWAVGRFFFAPLLAIVFFWIASLTNLVEVDINLNEPSFATLAFAFLIGMFPDNVYRTVSDVFHRVLPGSDDRLSPARRTVATPGVQPPTKSVDAANGGSPTSSVSLLADLRQRLQGVVTSVVGPVLPR